MTAIIRKLCLAFVVAMIIPASVAFAQDDTGDTSDAEQVATFPPTYSVDDYTYEAQRWNNCGPATLTMALSHFGYADNQVRAANWLKPNGEDKNVSPWQMTEFVNTQIPEIPVYAITRYGGTLDTLRVLVSHDFPVIIEAGYDPPRANQGWMGHYLLVKGYDDPAETIYTHDSYDGANHPYSYDHVREFWRHFNYTYIVLHEFDQQDELFALLGEDADEYTNYVNAFEIARAEAIANPNDSFAWHNMGSMYVAVGQFEDAATAFDQARTVGDGLPWRMLWYQFGMYEAYDAVGRYDETIALAQRTLNDGGGQYVEESYYYAGIAREGLGDINRAIQNYNQALAFNPNFEPARERRGALQSG
jgi:hypothetical protein